MRYLIRPGRPADQNAILAMLREFMGYFAAIDAGDSVPGTERGDADLARTAGLAFAPDPVCAVLIAERAGRPVAYLAYHFGVWETFPALYVAGLFVTASARGLGIGRALMAEAQRLAAARGAERIAWMVWRKNAPAIAFYEHLGATRHEEDMQMVWKVVEATGPNA